MDQLEIKKRTDALGPLFVRLALMGHPVSLSFTPEHEYPLAVVPELDEEKPEDAGLVMAAMIGNNDVHFVRTSDDELLIVHKEDT